MSVPSNVFCHREKTWFDTLSMGQLEELCKSSNVTHTSETKIDLVNRLSENGATNQFSSITIPHLKKMCELRSIPVSGLKYDLVLRILRHDNNNQADLNPPCFMIENWRDFLRSDDEMDAAIFREWHVDAPLTTAHAQAVFAFLATRIEEIHYNLHCSGIFRTPVEGFKTAESIFATILDFFHFITHSRMDSDDQLSVAIDRLVSIIFEVHSFLDKKEKKIAMDWITELDNNVSEYMIGENSKISLHELVYLLDDQIGPASLTAKREIVPKPKPTVMTNDCIKRRPLAPCENVMDVSKTVAVCDVQKPKKKIFTTRNVYNHMVKVIRKSSSKGNSEYVYKRLVRVIRSIVRLSKSRIDEYEAFELVEAAFKASIAHFHDIKNPSIDSDHNFTLAIDMLWELTGPALWVLSDKEKDCVLRWMRKLRSLTYPHGLGDIAEKPLEDIIQVVQYKIVG